jgi:hypothetical protein
MALRQRLTWRHGSTEQTFHRSPLFLVGVRQDDQPAQRQALFQAPPRTLRHQT